MNHKYQKTFLLPRYNKLTTTKTYKKAKAETKIIYQKMIQEGSKYHTIAGEMQKTTIHNRLPTNMEKCKCSTDNNSNSQKTTYNYLQNAQEYKKSGRTTNQYSQN